MTDSQFKIIKFDEELCNTIFRRDMINMLYVYCCLVFMTYIFLNIYELGLFATFFIFSSMLLVAEKHHPFSEKYMKYVLFFVTCMAVLIYYVVEIKQLNLESVTLAYFVGMISLIILTYALPTSIVGSVCFKLIFDKNNGCGISYKKSNRNFCIILGVLSIMTICVSVLFGYIVIGVNVLALIFMWFVIYMKYRCDEEIEYKNMMSIFKFNRDNWIHLSSLIGMVLLFAIIVYYKIIIHILF